MSMKRPSRRGFAIREMVALSSVAFVGVCLLAPMAARGAAQSNLQVCMARLKEISKLSGLFAGDYQGRIANLRGFTGMSSFHSLPNRVYQDNSGDDQASTADHAVDIIRTLGGREDLERIVSWVPQSSYFHLALAEYARLPLPSVDFACPEDANLLAWQSDPRNYNNLGVPAPVAPGALDNPGKRWPYSSSYVAPTATWTNDLHSPTRLAWYFNGPLSLVAQGGHTAGQTDLGHRRFDQVAFPSSKVQLHDRGARHFTPRAVYWGFADTKQPVLFFDGVVRTVRTGNAYLGWDPLSPDRNIPYSYSVDFTPSLFQWHPGRPEGETRGQLLFDAARWALTRDGLAGRDFP